MADDKAAKEVQERNADFSVLFCFMLFVFFLESANHFNDFLDEKRTKKIKTWIFLLKNSCFF